MTVQYKIVLASSISILVVVAVAGCGESNSATVKGRVTLDGIPLDRGTITFVVLGEEASGGVGGMIQEDGTYSIQIGRSGAVLTGEYAVKVVVLGPSIPDPKGGPPIPGELITPEHYASPATSGLRYNVRPGKNVIDVALSSKTIAPTSDETVVPGATDGATDDETAETTDDTAPKGDETEATEEDGSESDQETEVDVESEEDAQPEPDEETEVQP